MVGDGLHARELERLNLDLLEAHRADDHQQLVVLYERAGHLKEKGGDIDAACFYFTHAYVFALESGHGDAPELQRKLASYGREPGPDS